MATSLSLLEETGGDGARKAGGSGGAMTLGAKICPLKTFNGNGMRQRPPGADASNDDNSFLSPFPTFSIPASGTCA